MARSSGRTPSRADNLPAKDVVAARKKPRTVERPQVGHFLDHAQAALHRGAHPRRCRTRIAGVDITADRTGRQAGRSTSPPAPTSSGAIAVSRRSNEQMQHRAARRLRGPRPGSRASCWTSALRYHCDAMVDAVTAARGLRKPMPSARLSARSCGSSSWEPRPLPCQRSMRIAAAGHDVVRSLYSQPPRRRRIGGNAMLTRSAVHDRAAEALGLAVAHSANAARCRMCRPNFAALAADIAVVAAYGLDPAAALCSMRRAMGCINVHASLLPRWRGAAPDPACDPGRRCRQPASCIMQMEAGLDTGPVRLAAGHPGRRARPPAR